MSNRVYVGNLPAGFSSSLLKEAFEEIGAVQSAEVIQKVDPAGAAQFGFVVMATPLLARQAIEAFDRGFVGEHEIRVRPALFPSIGRTPAAA